MAYGKSGDEVIWDKIGRRMITEAQKPWLGVDYEWTSAVQPVGRQTFYIELQKRSQASQLTRTVSTATQPGNWKR